MTSAERTLVSLVQAAFHAGTASVGYKAYYWQDASCSSSLALFLMASGAVNGFCFLYSALASKSSSVPPMITLAALIVGAWAIVISHGGQCGSFPTLAAYATLLIQAATLVLAVFKVLSVALACFVLILLASGLASATHLTDLGLLSALAKAARPEFVPNELSW